MARTFDYERLRTLIREHPDWKHRQLALALTEHERRTDPSAPMISVHAIASVIHRYRDTWAEAGDEVPESRHNPMRRSHPFRGLPRESYHCYEIQALRTLGVMARGEPVSEKRRKEAERLEARLIASRSVIDVDNNGRVYTRPARPDELDQEGNLTGLTARYPGLTELEWRLLKTPEARAVESARWIQAA